MKTVKPQQGIYTLRHQTGELYADDNGFVYERQPSGALELVKIKPAKFKKQVMEMMAGNEEIVKGVENNTYDYENIVEVFNAYNKSVKN